MKKTIVIEIEHFKTNIVKNLAEEIKQDSQMKAHIIKNNDIILAKHNEVLKDLKKFLAENLGDFPITLESITRDKSGYVGLISNSLKSNFSSSDARLGFSLWTRSNYNHRYGTYELTGELSITLITRYETKEITINEIGQIFDMGRSTLKEMMKADFNYA